MAEFDTTIADTHQTQVAQRHYDPDGQEELTTAIIYAIAEATGVSPGELKAPPLYEFVDVDGIKQTFFSLGNNGDSRQGTGSVEFPYMEYRVEVRSDGWVRVYERTGADNS